MTARMAEVDLLVVESCRHGGINFRGKLRLAVTHVQPIDVQDVHDVFLALEPVALGCAADPWADPGVECPAVVHQDVVLGKLGDLIRRPHVGEEEAAELLHRIAGLLDALLLRAVGRLERHLEAVAFDVVEPSVVAAADALGLDTAVFEGYAPMAATEEQQTWAPVSIPECHQVLAQDTHPLRHVSQVLREADGLPETPASALRRAYPVRRASVRGLLSEYPDRMRYASTSPWNPNGLRRSNPCT